MTTDELVQVPDPWLLGVPPRSACPQDFLDLSDSASPHGCSPYAARRAIEAVGAAQTSWRSSLDKLRTSLSRKFSLGEDRILLGAGCRVLLPALLRGVCTPGDEVAVGAPPPPLYRLAAAQASVRLLEVPLTADFGHGPDTWIDVLQRKHPRVAVVGHPINPSGRHLTRDEVFALLQAASALDTIVVMDEAYADYAEKSDFPRLAPLLDDAPNLVIMRSFSSLQGLAGLPAAYALSAPETAERLHPILRGQEPGEVAARAATATVEEPSFDQLVCDRVGRSRFRLVQTLHEWNVPCEAGTGPWVMVAAADSTDGARRLAARGLRVRDLAPWGIRGWLRVRAGTDEDVARFLKDAKAVLTKRPG